MALITRAQWKARPSSGSLNAISSHPKGTAVHWEGPKMGIFSHSQCYAKVRFIQNFHMDTRGWSDIAYNFIACPHGHVFEGRGLKYGSAANGNTQDNHDYYAVCALVGQGDPQPGGLDDAIAEGVAICQTKAGDEVTGHRDHFNTACPGDDIYGKLKAGRYGKGNTSAASAIPAALEKPKPAPKPKPKPKSTAPKFPLKAGWYFGPKSGPAESVSGYFSHRADLKRWQAQMAKRGWSIDVDGLYGPNTEKIARQFQDEKGLSVDGLIGAETWAAAWKEPVT